MHKDIDYWPHRAWESPFVGLVTPTFGIAEAVVEAFGSLKDFIVRERESWRRRRLMARTIAELSSLDDYILRDIGLPREDIYSAACEATNDANYSYHRARGR